MRGYIPRYKWFSPSSLAETLDTLAREPGIWKPFAGGTDLMVLLEAGNLKDKNYLNIWNLKELRGIEVAHDYVDVGALTTYTEIQSHPVLKSEFPMLCQAASETGGLAIQNRGTIGGNIVNASPAADSPPALLVYGAELELLSSVGTRRVPYHGFHTGYKQMLIRPEELVARIRLPRTTGQVTHYYRKVGTRKAQAISKVCFAAFASTGNGRLNEIRVALGSVAPIPLRCVGAEDTLRGRPLAELNQRESNFSETVLAREIAPIDDIRSTANYRLKVSLNLFRDFLSSLRLVS